MSEHPMPYQWLLQLPDATLDALLPLKEAGNITLAQEPLTDLLYAELLALPFLRATKIARLLKTAKVQIVLPTPTPEGHAAEEPRPFSAFPACFAAFRSIRQA